MRARVRTESTTPHHHKSETERGSWCGEEQEEAAPSTSTDFFTDDNGSTFEGNINRVAAAGITLGCGNGMYCPTGLVTRGQMAAFLHRALS
jgi:hypothetical protein